MKVTPVRIRITERERDALELRKGGMTFERIAEQLGYADRSGAWRAVNAALSATLQEPSDELRRLECERLDALLLAMWPKALEGSTWHVDRCLAVMDRRAKLLGLDAPTRRIVDVITRDAFSQAMEELEAEIAELETVDGETVGDRGQS